MTLKGNNIYILDKKGLYSKYGDTFKAFKNKIELYQDPAKLLDDLKGKKHCFVFILSEKVGDDFIVKVSEEKVFHHHYFLIPSCECSPEEIYLNLSLGYEQIITKEKFSKDYLTKIISSIEKNTQAA